MYRPLLVAAVLLLACQPQTPPFPTTPVMPPALRPGLLFDAADVPVLQARLARPPYTAWWNTVLAVANQAAAGSPGSPSLSEETRARWAKAAAFAWRLGGDVRHRDAAALALGAIGTGPNTPINDLGPNLGGSSRTVLTASSHLQAACVGYDLVRASLTPTERSLAEARLAAAAELVFVQESVNPTNEVRVNNWRTKAAAAIATAGLALPAFVVAPGGSTPSDWLARGLAAIGQVLPLVVRNGWNREGAWYTTYSLGGGHAHSDPLGLLAFAQGEALLVDGGYGPTGFSSPNRNYYVLASGHNLLTYDGLAPWLTRNARLRGYGDAGRLAAFGADYETPLVPNPAIEAQVRRSILLAGPRALYVADEIVRGTASTLASLWHGRGTRTVVQEGGHEAEISWSRARIGSPATRLRVVATASRAISVVRASGFYSEVYGGEEPLDYVRLEAGAATSLRVLAAVDLGSPADAPLAVSRPSCPSHECLTVDDGAGHDVLLLGDGATVLAAGGVTAEGRFARVRREGGLVRTAQLEEGTRLEVDGNLLLSAARPSTLALSRGNPDTLVVSALVTAPLPVTVAVVGAPPLRVRWSEAFDLPFSVSPGGQMAFDVPYSGTVTLER